MLANGSRRVNTEQLHLSLDEAEAEADADPDRMTAESHWTLSAATPADDFEFPYSLYAYSDYTRSPNSSISSTHSLSSSYPDARCDPRRHALLQPPSAPLSSPPILILKLYRRSRAKKNATVKKISAAAQSSTKAVGKFLGVPNSSHQVLDGRTPRTQRNKLRRPPPPRRGMEISEPFAPPPSSTATTTGFESRHLPPGRPPPGRKNTSEHALCLPATIARSRSHIVTQRDISAPLPIHDLSSVTTRPGIDRKASARAAPAQRPCGPRPPSATANNFGEDHNRVIRRTKSERHAQLLPKENHALVQEDGRGRGQPFVTNVTTKTPYGRF